SNSLTQRTAANAERRGQSLLAYLAARLQVPADDRGLDTLGKRIHQRLRRDLLVQYAVHERLSRTTPSGARADTYRVASAKPLCLLVCPVAGNNQSWKPAFPQLSTTRRS